jgi:hypothetical protein
LTTSMKTPLAGCAALVCAVLLAGCGSDEAGSTTDEGGGFESLNELREAAVDAGLDCQTWTPAPVESGDGAHCGESVRLNWFADDDAARDAAEELSETLRDVGIAYTLLLGDNWFISADDADELQDDLGGEVVTGP